MFPQYSTPKNIIAKLALDTLLMRQRDFEADARACIRQLRPPLRVLGRQNIPQGGRYVITANHYYRPGYFSPWSALAISAAGPRGVHWAMTGELTYPGKWYAPIARPISRFVLGRVARVYGFTAMPPMPPRASDIEARAAAVRRLLRHIRRTEEAVIGLAPEGGDQPMGRLCMPPEGAGRLCLLLARAGLNFLPVGAYEYDGELRLNFGEAYELCLPPGTPNRDKDRAAAHSVMEHIAALLPTELRGEFG